MEGREVEPFGCMVKVSFHIADAHRSDGVKMGIGIKEVTERLYDANEVRHPLSPGELSAEKIAGTGIGGLRERAEQTTFLQEYRTNGLGQSEDRHAVGHVTGQYVFDNMFGPQRPASGFA